MHVGDVEALGPLVEDETGGRCRYTRWSGVAQQSRSQNAPRMHFDADATIKLNHDQCNQGNWYLGSVQVEQEPLVVSNGTTTNVIQCTLQ